MPSGNVAHPTAPAWARRKRANGEALAAIARDAGVSLRTVRTLWFSGEESGDPQTVADFVQGFLKQFRPNGSFSMGHTFSCSQPRLDGFGGGALFVTAEKIEHLDSFSWLWALCEEHKNRGTEQN